MSLNNIRSMKHDKVEKLIRFVHKKLKIDATNLKVAIIEEPTYRSMAGTMGIGRITPGGG